MPEPLMLPISVGSGPEERLVLASSRTRLSGEFVGRVRAIVQGGIDWIQLIRLAMRHEVMPLLYRNLEQACPDLVPENILAALRTRCRVQAAQAHRRAEELLRILTVTGQHGITAVPYKGPVLAERLYGDLALREFGDLDIMILEPDVPQVQALLRGLGYEFACLRDEGELARYIPANRELQFHLPSTGMRLELHWRFAMRSACVQQDPERFLQRLEKVSFFGSQVLGLPLESYFLVLSLHATKHKWRQLKLLVDIAEILGRDDVDWGRVLREAKDLNIRRILAVGVLLAQDALGAPVPAELSRGLKIDGASGRLAAEVRDNLFKEPDQHWHEQADFPFQVRVRERFLDRLSMLYRKLPSILTPDQRDKRFLPMPQFLSPIYYLVKPVRWTWQRISDR